jgi:hypothetical protein
VGGPNRITINALGFDSLPTSTFDGVIETQDDDLPGGEHRHQAPEQEPTGFERGPNGPIEHAMIGLKVRLIDVAHDAKN